MPNYSNILLTNKGINFGSFRISISWKNHIGNKRRVYIMNNFFKASDDVRKNFKRDWSRSKARTDLLHNFIKADIINKGIYSIELEKH